MYINIVMIICTSCKVIYSIALCKVIYSFFYFDKKEMNATYRTRKKTSLSFVVMSHTVLVKFP